MRSLTIFTAALLATTSAFAVEQPVPVEAPIDQTQTLAVDGAAALPKEGDQGEHVIALQVALDRARFSPGAIDGHFGRSTRKALAAYQESKGRDANGDVDNDSWSELTSTNMPALVRVTVDPGDLGPVGAPLPAKPEDLVGRKALDYGSLAEAVSEKFHVSKKALARLNNDKEIVAGAEIIVPNVEGAVVDPSTQAVGGPLETRAQAQFYSNLPAPTGAQATDAKWQATLNALSVEDVQPEAARVVVTKALNEVRVYDSANQLIAAFPATIGSDDNPSPEGELKINGVSRNPTFKYDTDVLNESGPKKQFTLSPGPNNLVGVVWLDLSKPHTGIHGTGEPDHIGQKASHGCIRLTNWDAARLAQMVKPGTPVTFQ